jgi:hypothetical protein
MLGKVWEKLEPHIRTGFNVSDKSYRSTVAKLLYSIGQGSCSSQLLWALLIQLILAALEEKNECIILVSVDKSTIST